MKKIKMKKITFFHDFKAFISKGNVIDLAVGVVIGTAFGAIVNSLVKDLIMPLLTWAMGGGSLAGAAVVLNGVPMYINGVLNPAAVLWNYGNFIQAIINFLIIALCVFVMLRVIMNVSKGAKGLMDKSKKAIEKELKKGKITAEQAAAKHAEIDAAAVAATVPAPHKETSDDLLREIRDLLKANAIKPEDINIPKVQSDKQ